MNESAELTLKSWETFYVIVGATAGSLTGLQFVVLTLIAESGVITNRGESTGVFDSPNIIHFCAVLLVSAILMAPWSSLTAPGAGTLLCGASGVIYMIVVSRRLVRESIQRIYKPVIEDWIWRIILPLAAYAVLLVAGALLMRHAIEASYVVGGVCLLLVFIGVHNAWDAIVFFIALRETPGGIPKREEHGTKSHAAAKPEAPRNRS